MDQNASKNPPPELLQTGSAPAEVPVFDCHVIVRGPDEDGNYIARAARLAGITGRGPTEREALRNVVAAFKAEVARFHQAGQPIPWSETDEKPGPREVERWIPVHL